VVTELLEVARAMEKGEDAMRARWSDAVHPYVQALPLESVCARWGFSVEAGRARLADIAMRLFSRSGGASSLAAIFERLGQPAILGDVVLLAAFREGSAAAHVEMRRLYGAYVATLVCRTLGSAGLDEHLGSVMSHIWERSPAFLAMSSLKTWLTVLVKNWCVDMVRREQARPRAMPHSEREDGEGDPLARCAAADSPAALDVTCREFADSIRSAARSAAALLEPAQRAILRLRYLEGRSQEAMSAAPELLGPGETRLEPYTITRRVQRAARALRGHLVADLGARGYGPDDVAELLEGCEGLSPEVAMQLREA
jgi:RNA polymerase sigma factor (sigma-70 family)